MSDPLAPLRERFRERVAGDLARLRHLRAGDLAGGELKALVHNLAGAAGTFGHPALSEAAMAIDDRYAVGTLPDAAQLALLEHRLAEIARPR